MKAERTNERVLGKLVRNPWAYRLLRPFLDAATLREDNEAFKIWMRFLLDITGRAYSRKEPVVWMSAFTPVEIAYGLGAVPFMPEITSAVVAHLGRSRQAIAESRTHLSGDLCSFYRCALGLALGGYLPRPDLIISSSQLCEGSNKFFNYLSGMYGCPHLFLDPPYDRDQGARDYIVGQLRVLLQEASRFLGLHAAPRDFVKVLSLSSRARELMVRINRLRRSSPAPFPGSEALSYLAGMNFYAPGSLWGVKFFQAICRRVEARAAEGRGYLPRESSRLLWLHHIRPYYPNDIFEMLGQGGAAVAFEEANYVYWPEPDPWSPLESLADKIVSNVWSGPLERRAEAVEKMVEDYHIDGVIHFSHWGCRQSCGGAGVIGDRLKKRGVPYIVLYGDGADPDNYSPGQTRIRLQAMLEMQR